VSDHGCKSEWPRGCAPHGAHFADRHQTVISDEEMRLGRQSIYREPKDNWPSFVMWMHHHADGTWSLARCDVDGGEEDDGWMVSGRIESNHEHNPTTGDYDEFHRLTVLYRADVVPDPDDDLLASKLVAREQLWPYIPPEVDVEAMLAVLQGLVTKES
jgi:hypothetical protein